MKADLLITNAQLLQYPGPDGFIPKGFIAVQGNQVAATGPMGKCHDIEAGTVLDGQGQLAMPGLVNGHCHAAMTLFRGMADDLPLHTWLNDHIFPAEQRDVTEEMVYWCSKLAAVEMLLCGITTVADGYFFEHAAAQAFTEAGIRAVPAQAILDFPVPGISDPNDNIRVARHFLEQWHETHPLIQPALFAHAPYTCSADTLVRAKQLAEEYQTNLFIHVAETKEEMQYIDAPLADSPLRHLGKLDLLNERTICVHCVWTDEKDRELLAATAASVVTCPQSNLKLASGKIDLEAMDQAGIPIGLGTDGPASNNSLDLFREMDLCAKIHKVNPGNPAAVPATKVLQLATESGAKIMGIPQLNGTITTGSLADIILLDLDSPSVQPFYTPNLLVYSNASSLVQTVIVNGKIVVQGRVPVYIDMEEIMAKVRQFTK